MLDFWIQLAFVLVALIIGARYGGAGLGVAGGLSLAVLVLVFGLRPSSPPIDVLLIITSVITCVAFLQAAGGLDCMVILAERMLRRFPNAITFLGPLLCYLLTVFCGTAFANFSLYPVIAEVATEAKVRPERPLSMSVLASQLAITGGPMSAATATMIALLAGYGVTPLKLMLVCIPAGFLGSLVGCLFMNKRGRELEDDPEFQRRVASGEFQALHKKEDTEQKTFSPTAKRSLYVFALAIFTVIILGTFNQLLPTWQVDGKTVKLSIPTMIQVVMLAYACILMLSCNVSPSKAMAGVVFRSGMTGVVAVYGIAWLTNTFFNTHRALFINTFGELLQAMPFLFIVALILLSMALMSQGATVVALMPLGLTLGMDPALLVAMFPAATGFFLLPAGPAQVACIAFDRTGTMHIGKYILNHSYMLPGLVITTTTLIISHFLAKIVF